VLLIGLIPLIGTIVLIVFFATDGEQQPNADLWTRLEDRPG